MSIFLGYALLITLSIQILVQCSAPPLRPRESGVILLTQYSTFSEIKWGPTCQSGPTSQAKSKYRSLEPVAQCAKKYSSSSWSNSEIRKTIPAFLGIHGLPAPLRARRRTLLRSAKRPNVEHRLYERGRVATWRCDQGAPRCRRTVKTERPSELMVLRSYDASLTDIC